MIKVRVFFVALFLFSFYGLYATDLLFRNGSTSYQIVLSSDASLSEKTASKELQDYLHRISGVLFPITYKSDPHCGHIYLGYSSKVAELTGQQRPASEDESYTYCRVGDDILIWGGAKRGTMYGVFSFLERELGVHWLTPTCTVIPPRKSWRLAHLYYHGSPAIGYRHNDYHVNSGHLSWIAHNKENMRGSENNEYGGQEGYWGCHTMGQLVSGNEFFQNHPEYFSLRNGKRVSEQLCLSNPEVLNLCIDRLSKIMRENPGFRIYCLSQNDNSSYCQCKQCIELENKYGGHSGIILWFVNQVADVISEEFPDKYVGTFAYTYSRKPPTGIVPRDNVVIRLCSAECCFAHPIESGCPQNKEFLKDLKGWSSIAKHLYIWDYIVDFAQYLAPWPNFQVLAPNIRTFCENHVIGVYEESNYQALGGEFEEMKSWMVDQLLWNPNQNTDSLANIFIKGYYGKSASRVKAYYRLCQSLVKRDTHFGIYIREDHEIYSDRFIKKAFKLLDEALLLADDEEIRERVERVYMQPLYLYCMRHNEESRLDGGWDELVRLMRKYNVRPSEAQSIDEFLSYSESFMLGKTSIGLFSTFFLS